MRKNLSRDLAQVARRWWLIVVLGLVGLALGGVYARVVPRTYTASSYVTVAAVDPLNSQAALGFAQAYGRIASSPQILVDASRVAGIPEPELSTSLQTSTSPDAPLIQITALSVDPQRATNAANATADVFTVFGNTHTPDTGMRVATLSAAAVPTEPSSIGTGTALAVGAGAGVLLGALAVAAGLGRIPERRRASSRSDTPVEEPDPADTTVGDDGPARTGRTPGTTPEERRPRYSPRWPRQFPASGPVSTAAGGTRGPGRTGTNGRPVPSGRAALLDAPTARVPRVSLAEQAVTKPGSRPSPRPRAAGNRSEAETSAERPGMSGASVPPEFAEPDAAETPEEAADKESPADDASSNPGPQEVGPSAEAEASEGAERPEETEVPDAAHPVTTERSESAGAPAAREDRSDADE